MDIDWRSVAARMAQATGGGYSHVLNGTEIDAVHDALDDLEAAQRSAPEVAERLSREARTRSRHTRYGGYPVPDPTAPVDMGTALDQARRSNSAVMQYRSNAVGQ